MKAALRKVASQPSWVIRSPDVELAVTQLGGQMAPVKFYRSSVRAIQPYYICPWHGEGRKIDEPVLASLRGDFFCLPFGANAAACAGERHRVHGEPAGAKWSLVSAKNSGGVTSITLRMRTKVRPGTVTKRLSLVDGQNVVYCRHELEGFSGRMPLGHHATLAMPDQERSVLVATSPIRYGRTNAVQTGDPATGEYSCLAVGKKFRSLSRVPLIWSEPAFDDLSSFPARTGFTDLLAVFNKPGIFPAWTAATFTRQGFVWFSLKDAAVQPTTLLWVSNRGRHTPPWDGRNRCLGLEDVCGFFAEGLKDSVRANVLSKDGIATAVKFSPKRPTAVNYIQGVVKVPRGFARVASARFTPGKVTFRSVTGAEVTVPVNHEFLRTGKL